MYSEEEIKNKFQFYVEEGGIIRIKILEPPEDADEYVRQAVLGKNYVAKVCLKNPNKDYKILMDLSAIRNKNISSVQSRRIYHQIMEHPQIKKIAILGQGSFLRTMLNLIITTSGKGGMLRWFSNQKEALKWLKE